MKRDRFARGGRRESAEARKAAQLCRQIRDTIEFSISTRFDHEALEGAWVAEVTEEAGGRSVRVHVLVADADAIAGAAHFLEGACGWLRAEVAQAIHRKRTPHLRFSVWPADAFFHASGDEEADDEE